MTAYTGPERRASPDACPHPAQRGGIELAVGLAFWWIFGLSVIGAAYVLGRLL